MIADIRKVSPDLVLHGGDLADAGSSPVEVVDRIRGLGWNGTKGNTDEMLTTPEALEEYANTSKAPASMWRAIREMAAVTRNRLGTNRLAWLNNLPLVYRTPELAVVHASPTDCWRAPGTNASNEELKENYLKLERRIVIFGHIHEPFVRELTGVPGIVANSGSVGLPYDGDVRGSYLLIDDGRVSIKRVEYDLSKEIKLLSDSNLPGFEWTARMLKSAAPTMP